MNKIFENYFKQNLKEDYDQEGQKRLASAMARVRKTGDTDREAVVDIQDVEDQDLQQLKDKYLKDAMFRKSVDNRLSDFVTGVDRIVTIDPEIDFMKDLKSNYTQQVRGINEENISYRLPGPIVKKSGYSAGGDRPEAVSIPGTDFPHVNIGQGKFIYKWDDGDIENWNASNRSQKQNVFKRIKEKASDAHKEYIKGLQEFSDGFGNKDAAINVAQAENPFPAGIPLPGSVATIEQRYKRFAHEHQKQADYKKKLKAIARLTPKSDWDKQDALAADQERYVVQQKDSADRAATDASTQLKLNKVAGALRENVDISTSDSEVDEIANIVVDEINAVFSQLPDGSPLKSREVALAALEQIKNALPAMIQGMNVG